MKQCFTYRKCANRLNINTAYRVHIPHRLSSVSSVVSSSASSLSPSPSVSKASRLPWYVRFVLWIKRHIFRMSC